MAVAPKVAKRAAQATSIVYSIAYSLKPQIANSQIVFLIVSNLQAVQLECSFSLNSVILRFLTSGRMKDLTHYFSDSLKASKTPAESKEVSIKNPKVAEMNTKYKKTNSVPKKRGRKKSKIASPDSDVSKKTKCDLGIEKHKPLANGKKDNCIKEIPDAEGFSSPKNMSEENLHENSFGNSVLKEAEFNEPLKNEEQLTDGVSKDKNGMTTMMIVQEQEEEENIQIGTPDENVDINISNQTSEKLVSFLSFIK